MSHDPFENAGRAFRDKTVRETAGRDQAIEALKRIEVFCKDGVKKFYGGAMADVYFDHISDTQLQILYGYRQCKHLGILEGPYAQIVVLPDGQLCWGHVTEWRKDVSSTHFDLEALDANDYEAGITPKLIEFLTGSEDDYRRRNL